MSTEEELLEKIFGETGPMWKGKYKIHWCDLCQTYSAGCPDCSGSSCNCMGCEKCSEDTQEFSKTKPWPTHYLSEEDKLAVERHNQIKRWLRDGYLEGQYGLDWDWLYYHGKFCGNDWELFNLKYEPYETALLKPENTEKWKFKY